MIEDLSKIRETAEKAFKTEFRKGFDEIEPGSDYKTYSIDVSYFDGVEYPSGRTKVGWHGDKIKVFGDEALRDRILKELQK